MSNINNKDSSTEWNCKEDVGCVPPRRQNLNMERLDNENEDSVPDFMKKTFYLAAAGEGKKLREKHDESCDEFCDAWNRSLADYKDIFQGKDMWNDGKYGEAKNHIKNAFGDMNNRKAMLNEIEKGIKDETFSRENGLDVCKSQCEERSRDDTEDQFLRFFAEWEEEFCDGLNK
ncbi:antigen 332, DBL-like protein, partial [Plasmodium sp. gorilla clade G1]